MIRIRRGLDVPLPGAPDGAVETASVRHVAIVGDDHAGLRPRLAVAVGERVRRGQLLLTDRRDEEIRFTSPGAGEIVAIHRGPKRRFQSVVVRLDDDEREEEQGVPAARDRDAVRGALVASGLWTALRARPFGRTPPPRSTPASIFVTAMDSEPLAPDPLRVLDAADFADGLRLVKQLTDGPVHVCARPGATVPGADLAGIAVHEFAGPHPSGLAGTHIHFLDPVDRDRSVWHVAAEDVAAFGGLFRTGRLPVERTITVAGPAVAQPRLVRTRLGASTDELLAGRLAPGPCRAISGSALSGRTARGETAFLGRFHRQVCAIPDVGPRRFLPWLRRGRRWTTASHGEPGPIWPLRVYEKVMPLDLLPTPLLKALAVGDIDRAIELGCLELIEEDLALCSYVSPSKDDFGARLRAVLDTIEREG